MKSTNIPEVKLGIIAVSRDCFPIALSEKRRAAIAAACQTRGVALYECKTTVENEHDMQKAVAEVTEAGCNALTVFLGNFGPETPETLIAKFFDGPCMFVAAAEGDGDMINGRGDAYCGMLNCSYNLGMRHLKGYIPEYPVGTAEEIAEIAWDRRCTDGAEEQQRQIVRQLNTGLRIGKARAVKPEHHAEVLYEPRHVGVIENVPAEDDQKHRAEPAQQIRHATHRFFSQLLFNGEDHEEI